MRSSRNLPVERKEGSIQQQGTQCLLSPLGPAQNLPNIPIYILFPLLRSIDDAVDDLIVAIVHMAPFVRHDAEHSKNIRMVHGCMQVSLCARLPNVCLRICQISYVGGLL